MCSFQFHEHNLATFRFVYSPNTFVHSSCHSVNKRQFKKVPSTSWSLLPMSSVEQTAEAQIQLSLPKVKSWSDNMMWGEAACYYGTVQFRIQYQLLQCGVFWIKCFSSVTVQRVLLTYGQSLQSPGLSKCGCFTIQGYFTGIMINNSPSQCSFLQVLIHHVWCLSL